MRDSKEANIEKVFGKNENLVIKFSQWVLNRYLKKDDNDALQLKANEIREKMLE